MRILVFLAAAIMFPAIASATQNDPRCRAHAKMIATDFRALESQSGVHPLDMSQNRLRDLLTGYLQSNNRARKDLARQVVISIQLSLQDGCGDLKNELENFR